MILAWTVPGRNRSAAHRVLEREARPPPLARWYELSGRDTRCTAHGIRTSLLSREVEVEAFLPDLFPSWLPVERSTRRTGQPRLAHGIEPREKSRTVREGKSPEYEAQEPKSPTRVREREEDLYRST